MINRQKLTFSALFLTTSLFFIADAASAAQSRLHDRIKGRIEAESSTVVRGHIHPLANSAHDRGKAGRFFRLERVTVMLKPSDAQQAELDALLVDQHDPASPNYHRWLSPEEFAARFGLTDNDIGKIVTWLEDRGLAVNEVGRSRRSVTFSGRSYQVEQAFRTSIHEYDVDGQTYYANATEPSVPAALSNVVLGFRALNNFPVRPRVRKRMVDVPVSPDFTSSTSGNHYLSPADFATIYGLGPLYAAGLDGRGQKIAVAGQTDIDLGDIRTFRAVSGLPASDPEVILVPGATDPGIINDDLGEADLDLEWAGAVAPNAHLIYVNASNVFDSLQYAIDQNIAPVVSISYGACERDFGQQDVHTLAALGAQANAQGMTIVAASGDTGAADCDRMNSSSAFNGLAVDVPASLPYVTGMGGTEFRETTTAWSPTNTSTWGSALSYIPEVAWNDTSSRTLSAGGGGRSMYFGKPSWQTGSGVPNDAARDVPDLSLNSSGDHDGYLVCSQGSCVNGYRSPDGSLIVVGGTSAAAPAFAGMVAIINQKAGTPQGNVNPVLYRLAGSSPSVFHDIVTGGNQVPCRTGSIDCTNGSLGYSAGPGYDQATGLGSVNAYSLVTSWPASGSSSPGGTPATPGTPGTPDQTPVTVPQPISVVEQGSIRSGYMVIRPDSNQPAPTPTVTFGMISSAVVLSQAGITPIPLITDGSLFADVIPGIGRNLGVALVNFGGALNTVTLTLRDRAGNTVGAPVSLTLAPQQQMARFVSEIFPASTLGAGFLGSVRLQGTTPFGVLGLKFFGTQFSTLPVSVNFASSASTTVVLPQFALGGGWATQLALVNNTSSALSGRVDVFDTSGNPMPVELNGASQSSFTYSLSPGGTLVLAPRDVNGQSPF